MLLESVHQRSRFQEAIEQLELAEKQRLTESVQQDERELLEHVRNETQRTLGVSFTSLLRFISDHLLTQSERDLQAIFFAEPNDAAFEFVDTRRAENAAPFPSSEQALPLLKDIQARDRKDPFAETLSLLAQTTDLL